MDQETIMRAMEIQKQSEEAENGLKFINEQIGELENFNKSLEVMQKNKEKEILAPIGKGVYMKADIREKEKLFVEVGKGVVIRKTPAEAQEVIEEQIKKFQNAKMQVIAQLEEYAMMLKEIISEIEKEKKA
jgi:prefoldin alpha subunit